MHQYKDIGLMTLIRLTKSNALNKTNRSGNMDIISSEEKGKKINYIVSVWEIRLDQQTLTHNFRICPSVFQKHQTGWPTEKKKL